MQQTARVRVLHVLASANRRGAEVFGTQLAVELDRLGHHDEVIALTPAADATTALDVPVVPALARPGGARELRRRAKATDVVLGHGSRGLVAGTLASTAGGPPLVYRSIGDPTFWGSSRARRLRVGLQLRRAARVTALWPAAADAIAARYGVAAERIDVVPNAADAHAFVPASDLTRAEARRALGIADETPVVAYVGALAAEKRVPLVVRAAALVPDAVLIVAGTGPMAHDVSAAATQHLPGRHHLLGAVADVRSVYAAADVVALRSATEGQPGVAIEAALCGLPVVSTDVGGVGSVVVDGETGRLVAPDASDEAMAQALGDALTHRSTLGVRARAHASAAFSLEVVGRQFADVLERVR